MLTDWSPGTPFPISQKSSQDQALATLPPVVALGVPEGSSFSEAIHHLAKKNDIVITVQPQFVSIWSTYRPFQIAYEGDFWPLYIVTFWQKV